MTAPRHSRQEKLLFSGREDDFPAFLEQFEARVYALGLSDCLLDRIKTTPQKDVETNDERVKREGEEADRAKLQYMVWCELVQCLDKASINFIRGHKPNGTAAWTALTKLHKSTERPRVQSLMTNDELFSVMAQPVETGSLAMMSHSIKHWHRVMGHNNWHDVAKLQQGVVGMNISGSEKKTNCNICWGGRK